MEKKSLTGWVSKTAIQEIKWLSGRWVVPQLITPPIWKNKGFSDFIKVRITIEEIRGD